MRKYLSARCLLFLSALGLILGIAALPSAAKPLRELFCTCPQATNKCDMYCCRKCDVVENDARCVDSCWSSEPGRPTNTPPAAGATLPPIHWTRQARTKTAVAAATETIEEQVPGCADRCDCRTGNGGGYCGGENEFCDCDDKYEWKHHNYDVVGSPAYDEWQQRVEKMVYGE